MSTTKTRDFFSVDKTAEATFQGRVRQGRRELACLLRRDITEGQLAKAAGVTGGAMTQWMRGRLPTRDNMKKLAAVFLKAGLDRYTDIYLERGERVARDLHDFDERASEPEQGKRRA